MIYIDENVTTKTRWKRLKSFLFLFVPVLLAAKYVRYIPIQILNDIAHFTVSYNGIHARS